MNDLERMEQEERLRLLDAHIKSLPPDAGPIEPEPEIEVKAEPEPDPEPEIIRTPTNGTLVIEFDKAEIVRDEDGRVSQIIGDGWTKTVERDEHGRMVAVIEQRERETINPEETP